MKRCTSRQFFRNRTICFLPFCVHYFHYSLRISPYDRAISTSSQSYALLTPDSMLHSILLHQQLVMHQTHCSTLPPQILVTRLLATLPIAILHTLQPIFLDPTSADTSHRLLYCLSLQPISPLPNPTPRIPITQLLGQGVHLLKELCPISG